MSGAFLLGGSRSVCIIAGSPFGVLKWGRITARRDEQQARGQFVRAYTHYRFVRIVTEV
jgi:hypothetical protein